MYYRIIVKKNGAFLFRTSKIPTAYVMLNIRAGIAAGFQDQSGDPATQEYTVEVLVVDGLPQGSILSSGQLEALNNKVLEDQAEAGPQD